MMSRQSRGSMWKGKGHDRPHECVGSDILWSHTTAIGNFIQHQQLMLMPVGLYATPHNHDVVCRSYSYAWQRKIKELGAGSNCVPSLCQGQPPKPATALLGQGKSTDKKKFQQA